ncbi:hypothetical protein AV274_0454 [Blastocystis sp. ATCC 50177/Nand II]|uniref:YEATS domain-containing protein n=1 Tax=Blastocystis sp. subtype 1 (strain ATCC 50177 / NandII) TaxID=478820 RepID=A0A196SL57_BLAHN|nr:hypothetical protein AV274_0454 [Blastocystis sp. ATCC 50177/Nand II]
MQRKADTHVVIPFVHGSIAWWMGNSNEQSNMYDWKVYIRGVNGEDMSTFIKSATFTLHASFRQNQRVIDHFPFEVREQGWGEFEVEVKVEFKNDAELPVTFTHFLKLHPFNGEPSRENVPVVNEYYDEFVFNDPTEYMYQLYPINPMTASFTLR